MPGDRGPDIQNDEMTQPDSILLKKGQSRNGLGSHEPIHSLGSISEHVGGEGHQKNRKNQPKGTTLVGRKGASFGSGGDNQKNLCTARWRAVVDWDSTLQPKARNTQRFNLVGNGPRRDSALSFSKKKNKKADWGT